MSRIVFAVAVLVPTLALADVGDFEPPKPCTFEARVSAGYDCMGCDGSASDAAACGKRLRPEGYSQECRGPGRTSWKEIWCRQHRAVPPGRETPPALLASVESVTASSSMPEGGGYSFDAKNLTDRDLTTSWQPKKNAKGGKGEWVLVSFREEVTLAGVGIANGFQAQDRFGDEFALNSRVKSARLVFSDASEETVEFDPEQRGLTEVVFSARKVKWVKLVIEAVHPGSKWKDLAVSELVLTDDVPKAPKPAADDKQAPSM